MLIQTILDTKGTEVFHIKPENTVYEAIEKMAEKNIGALLVMEKDRLLGTITERDYRNKVILKGRASKTTKVHKIMVSDMYFVKPDDTVDTGMALMTEKRVRHLPVIKDEKVAGIVSIGDLVKAVISDQKGEIHTLRNYISGTYPG